MQSPKPGPSQPPAQPEKFWSRSVGSLQVLPGPSTLPPRNDNMASEADGLAVIGRNWLQRIWQIESHQQPKLGLCRQPRGSGRPPHMVKRGLERGQILTQTGKLVPGAVSLPLLTLRTWGRASSPLAAKVSSGRGWGKVYKNLLVETTSPTGRPTGLCSLPATSQQSPNPEPCVSWA